MTEQTQPTAVQEAVDRMASVFGHSGKAALAVFMAALPSDATICWGDDPTWVSASDIAYELHQELAHDA